MDALMRELSGVLRGLSEAAGGVAARDPVGLLVRVVEGSTGISEYGGIGVCARDAVRGGMSKVWDVRRDFALACALRAYGLTRGMMETAARRDVKGMLGEAVDGIEQQARQGGVVGVVGERLWGHWLLMLGCEVLGRSVDERLLAELWEAGTGGQDEEGRLHRMDAVRSLDGFVMDELVALHAAANAAVTVGRAEMLEVVHAVARYHVENTQPDNTTNLPWGLAGFAMFEDTRSFAEQQMHDVRAHEASGGMAAAEVPMAAGLVADAVLTLRRMGG